MHKRVTLKGILTFKFTVPCIVILYYNNPTRCSCAQSILFHCSVTLRVSGAFHTHHQEYINCIYSLRCRSYCKVEKYLTVWMSM